MGFREDAVLWETETWEQAIKRFNSDSETLQVINNLKLVGKKVSGESVQRLPKDIKSEGRLPEVFLFTKIFHDDSAINILHPVQFISFICHKYEEYKKNRANYAVPIWGICSRGMRTLASFYREIDFKERLTKILPKHNLNTFEIVQNAEEDARGHADLVLKVSEKEFRIWLFQLTDRGIIHTTDRLFGNRGNLVKGAHIICGQNTLVQEQYDDVCGWRLYSQKIIDECVAEIKEILNGKTQLDYSYVKKILNTQKEFLMKVNSFEVK